ncbi:hypothetical protein MKW94_011604 [Papaver nudicaule]|uniref:Uncharacterized protein n=1 Tax=Papaver nudicaule TaxID=74823 RepID=A0AA41SDA8_PAPNU|nr:hypothetical protein [Papaver nudicaule]MCL7037359.1 hypothetical protein [Papaver nudicaule]
MSSTKRTSRLSLPAQNQKATSKSNLLEAIAQFHGAGVVSHTDENGVVRMKILVKKQDLKQMLEMMDNGKESSSNDNTQQHVQSSSLSLEQRIHVMRRKHQRRAEKGGRTWRPALQSIPEDNCNL